MFNSFPLRAARVVVGWSLAALAVASAAATSPSDPPMAGDPVVVAIASETALRLSDLRAYASRRLDLKPLLLTFDGLQRIADEWAMTQALIREGQRLGIARRDDPGASSDQMRDDIYALAVYRTLVRECPRPTGEVEVRRFFDDHPEQFRTPPQVRLSRVILPASSHIDGFPAVAWMGHQARAVVMGAARFEAIVQRAEAAHPKLGQGDIGWVFIDARHPLLDAIGSAAPGEIVGPVQEGDFAVMVRVEERREPRQLSWADVRHQVPVVAQRVCQEGERARVRNDLYQRYRITIDASALQAALAKGLQQ